MVPPDHLKTKSVRRIVAIRRNVRFDHDVYGVDFCIATEPSWYRTDLAMVARPPSVPSARYAMGQIPPTGATRRKIILSRICDKMIGVFENEDLSGENAPSGRRSNFSPGGETSRNSTIAVYAMLLAHRGNQRIRLGDRALTPREWESESGALTSRSGGIDWGRVRTV